MSYPPMWPVVDPSGGYGGYLPPAVADWASGIAAYGTPQAPLPASIGYQPNPLSLGVPGLQSPVPGSPATLGLRGTPPLPGSGGAPPNVTPAMQWAGLGIQGIGVAANLGLGAASLINAYQQYNLQKNLANRNLANQAAAYNQAQSDRIRAKYGGSDSAAVQNEINQHQVSGAPVG